MRFHVNSQLTLARFIIMFESKLLDFISMSTITKTSLVSNQNPNHISIVKMTIVYARHDLLSFSSHIVHTIYTQFMAQRMKRTRTRASKGNIKVLFCVHLLQGQTNENRIRQRNIWIPFNVIFPIFWADSMIPFQYV